MGNRVILNSPANLLTDYFYIANIGAAMWNAGLMVLKSIVILKLSKVQLSGAHLAAVFTVAGFSLFGKNLYNSLPIILGVFMFTKMYRVPFKEYLLPALYGTALGPLVSEITFNVGLPLQFGYPLGILVGVFTGLILPPLSEHTKGFHQGLSLYNIGFAAGLIGTFAIAILRGFDVSITTVSLVSSGNNHALTIFMSLLFGMMLILGFLWNESSFHGLKDLLQEKNLIKRDYVLAFNLPVTLINMALMGFLGLAYVLAVGGEINGPVIGGILTMVGFGSYGKHPLNCIPIMIGVFLTGILSIHQVTSMSMLLAALFGTTLAPITQLYGPLAGIVAGSLHTFLVVNVGILHAGMNLYNNGFSGGFVAAALSAWYDAIDQYRRGEKAKGYLYRRIK